MQKGVSRFRPPDGPGGNGLGETGFGNDVGVGDNVDCDGDDPSILISAQLAYSSCGPNPMPDLPFSDPFFVFVKKYYDKT